MNRTLLVPRLRVHDKDAGAVRWLPLAGVWDVGALGEWYALEGDGDEWLRRERPGNEDMLWVAYEGAPRATHAGTVARLVELAPALRPPYPATQGEGDGVVWVPREGQLEFFRALEARSRREAGLWRRVVWLGQTLTALRLPFGEPWRYLRPVARIAVEVERFRRDAVGAGPYHGVHRRGLEGKCERWVSLVYRGELPAANGGTLDRKKALCRVGHAAAAAEWRAAGAPRPRAWVLASDGADRDGDLAFAEEAGRAGERVHRFNASGLDGPLDAVAADMWLLAGAQFFVGCPASSLTANVVAARARRGLPSNVPEAEGFFERARIK